MWLISPRANQAGSSLPPDATMPLKAKANIACALPLPGAPFVGQSFYAQAFVFDPAHSRGASVSNAVELRAGY